MKNTRRIISAVLAFSMITALTGCKMIEKTPERIAKQTAFKVNGKKVTRGEIDDRITYVDKQLKQQYGENYASNEDAKEILLEQRKKMVDILVKNAVIKDKAIELGIKLDEKAVKEAIDSDKKQTRERFKTDEEYKKALKEENLTEEKLLARIRENTEAQMYLDKLYDHITKGVKADEKELKEYYNKNQKDYTEKPNGVKLAEIVVKTEEEAKAIKKQIEGGADFTKLAKEKSIDTTTKNKGGDLGFIEYSKLYEKTYLVGAVGAKAGDILEPSQSEKGYHVVKVLEKTNYLPESFDKVKDRVSDKVLTDKKMKLYEDTMKKWEEEAKIKIYEDNLK